MHVQRPTCMGVFDAGDEAEERLSKAAVPHANSCSRGGRGASVGVGGIGDSGASGECGGGVACGLHGDEETAVKIEAGWSHTVILSNRGRIVSFGRSDMGQCSP